MDIIEVFSDEVLFEILNYCLWQDLLNLYKLSKNWRQWMIKNEQSLFKNQCNLLWKSYIPNVFVTSWKKVILNIQRWKIAEKVELCNNFQEFMTFYDDLHPNHFIEREYCCFCGMNRLNNSPQIYVTYAFFLTKINPSHPYIFQLYSTALEKSQNKESRDYRWLQYAYTTFLWKEESEILEAFQFYKKLSRCYQQRADDAIKCFWMTTYHPHDLVIRSISLNYIDAENSFANPFLPLTKKRLTWVDLFLFFTRYSDSEDIKQVIKVICQNAKDLSFIDFYKLSKRETYFEKDIIKKIENIFLEYIKLIQSQPYEDKYFQVYYYYAKFLYKQKRYAESRSYFEESLHNPVFHCSYYRKYIHLLLKQSKIEKMDLLMNLQSTLQSFSFHKSLVLFISSIVGFHLYDLPKAEEIIDQFIANYNHYDKDRFVIFHRALILTLQEENKEKIQKGLNLFGSLLNTQNIEKTGFYCFILFMLSFFEKDNNKKKSYRVELKKVIYSKVPRDSKIKLYIPKKNCLFIFEEDRIWYGLLRRILLRKEYDFEKLDKWVT